MTTVEVGVQTNQFSKSWRLSFGFCPPLGHVLRHDYRHCWTRFHALPGSKRYAECDEELGIIIERANTLATECFGEQAPFWIAAGYSSDYTLKNNDLPNRMNMSEAMIWIDNDEEPEEQSEMSFFASQQKWKRRSLDRLFREIAEDQERAILFSEDVQTVLAPYDGGFDIISLQPGKIIQLENSYRTWMSSRPDKL